MGKKLLDSILIIIPSYEDPSLISTIQGAMDNAKYPERLHFAVGLQHKRIMLDLSIYKNLTVIDYGVENRPGLIQVRNDLASMSADYDYVLSIDAHMTFTKDWDHNIIFDYEKIQERAGTDKVAISCQVTHSKTFPLLEPCNCTEPKQKNIHSITSFNANNPVDGTFTLFDNAAPTFEVTEHIDYLPVVYTSMDLFFISSKYFKEHKFFIDKLKMYNDEPLASYLLFMRGWKAYRPYGPVYAYHDWNPYKFEQEKNFAALPDSEKDMHDCRMLMLYNSGPFAIESDKTPEEFYIAAGLIDHYRAIVENPKYKNTYL